MISEAGGNPPENERMSCEKGSLLKGKFHLSSNHYYFRDYVSFQGYTVWAPTSYKQGANNSTYRGHI